MPRGFTLIEVLITAAIVAVLASIAMPLAELASQRGKETELRRSLMQIRDALDAYKRASDEGRILRSPADSGYPPTLAVLVEGVPDAKSPTGSKIHFLRRLPSDPLAPDGAWGLRSYESPHDAPRPGKDVFDVYSLSTRTGLNGIPFKDW